MTQYTDHDFIEHILEEEWLSVYNHNQKLMAKKLKISTAYLNDILKRRRKLSDNFLKQVGYERISYIRKLQPANTEGGDGE